MALVWSGGLEDGICCYLNVCWNDCVSICLVLQVLEGVSVIECVHWCVFLCCVVFLLQARLMVLRVLLDECGYVFAVCYAAC